jgi:CopG family nickel-responsive transcriptional regulator
MAVVSVSMPDELLERLDTFADEHGYTGRSEVVREAARNLLSEFEDARLEDRELIGLVTVVFNYATTNVEERLMGIRHEHEHLVTANVHNHVGEQYCMELFVLEGSLADISSFVGQVRATRDTLTVDYSVLPVDEFPAAPEDAQADAGHGDASEAGDDADERTEETDGVAGETTTEE